jgi:hypothetical protein
MMGYNRDTGWVEQLFERDVEGFASSLELRNPSNVKREHDCICFTRRNYLWTICTIKVHILAIAIAPLDRYSKPNPRHLEPDDSASSSSGQFELSTGGGVN